MKLAFSSIPVLLFAACATNAPLTTEQAFQRADANGDGMLSRSEATDLMIASAFKAMDADGDGFLSESEYIAAGGTAENFKKYDTSGSGGLSLSEAQANPAAVEHMAMPFDEADVNNNGAISLDEALAYQKKLDEAVR